MKAMNRWVATVLAVGIAAWGCGGSGDGGAGSQAESGAGQAAGGAVTSQEGTRQESAAGIQFAVPVDWSAVPSTSSMRAAEFKIPGDGGKDGDLVLYFFGEGQGGGTDANIERWIGQMLDEEGQPATGSAERGTRTVGDLKVTTVTVEGTYTASMMPGMGGDTSEPGFALWGAVIEGPGGPWFFKAVGPKNVMNAATKHLDALLESVRVGT